MKKLLKYFLAFCLTVFLASGLLAQNGFVGSGYIMQAPRCTRATIASPYKGLIIYDTVALHYFGYTPNGWQILDSGAVDPSNLQYLTAGFGLKSNGNYNTLDPRTFSIDDSIVALKSDLEFVAGTDTPNYIIDTIINAPLASPVPGITYLVGTAPTGIFVGHANQPADFVTGTTYTYHTPILGDQGVVGRPFEYIYFDGANWIVKPNKSVQTNYYDYGNKIFIGQAKAKAVDFGVKKKAIISFTSTGKLRFPYLTYVPAHPFLTVDPLDSNSVILDSFDVAIYFDSLRNNSGVLEGRKAGVWIPQFTLPTGGGGSFNFDSALATKTTDNLTQGSTNLYNQTHTGDATGATALTVVGIRTKSIPTLSAGFLKYSGSAWAFDNNTYLTSYTETDPLALKITNNLSDLNSASTARTNLGLGSFATLTNPATTNKDFIYFDGTDYQRLAKGSNGQHLIINASGNYVWVDSSAGGGGSYTAGRGLGLSGSQFYHDTTQSILYLADQMFSNHKGFILKGADTTRDIKFSNIGTQPGLANIFITPVTQGADKEVSVDINFSGKGKVFVGDTSKAQMYWYNIPYDSVSGNEEAFYAKTTGVNGFIIGNRANGTGVLRTIAFNATGTATKSGSNLILNTDGTSLFQNNVGIGVSATAYSNYNSFALGAASSGGLIDFERGSTRKYQLFNDGSDIFHLYSYLTTADVITVSNTGASTKITGSNGGGLYLGGYSSGFGGFWSSGVSPTTSNYALIASSSTTALNVPTGGAGRFFVNDATIMGGWNIGGWYFGPSAITPTALLQIEAGAAGAGKAPLKLTSGTNLTTAEAGAFEYNGTNLFFTRTGTTRESVLSANSVNVVSPTSPNRTITVVIDGTTYYLAAKTTND